MQGKKTTSKAYIHTFRLPQIVCVTAEFRVVFRKIQ